MINKKEIISILAVILSLSISFTLFNGISVFPKILLAVFLVILISTLAKKIMGFYLESEVEMGAWTIKRYFIAPSKEWLSPDRYFKRPFQAGVILPLLTSLVSLGHFVWMASVIFDVKPKVYRAARRHGLYSFSEITEDHMGFIAASGVVANLFFAAVGYLVGFPEFSRISLYFAFFNMIPISDLDGNKILFGNKVLWCFLAALTLVGMGYAFLLI